MIKILQKILLLISFSAFLGLSIYLFYGNAGLAKAISIAFFFLVLIFLLISNLTKIHSGKF